MVRVLLLLLTEWRWWWSSLRVVRSACVYVCVCAPSVRVTRSVGACGGRVHDPLATSGLDGGRRHCSLSTAHFEAALWHLGAFPIHLDCEWQTSDGPARAHAHRGCMPCLRCVVGRASGLSWCSCPVECRRPSEKGWKFCVAGRVMVH